MEIGKSFKKRIKNLEFRMCSYLGELPEYPSWNIIYWYPNSYYGKESEYIKDGEFYKPKDAEYYKIHKDCFKHPESCYSLLFFEYDNHEHIYEIRFIGDRPLDLNKEERDTLWDLMKIGDKYLNEFKNGED